MKIHSLASSVLLLALLLAACGTDAAPRETDALGEPAWYTMRNAQTALCLTTRFDQYGNPYLTTSTCENRGDQNFRLEYRNSALVGSYRQLISRVHAHECVYGSDSGSVNFSNCFPSGAATNDPSSINLAVEKSGTGLRYKFDRGNCLGVNPNQRGVPVSLPCDGSAEQQWVLQYSGY